MADYQGNFLNALTGGLQFGQQIKQQQDTNKLSGLASLAYGTSPQDRPSLLAQMAGVSPGFAQAQQKAWNAEDDRDKSELIGYSRFIKNAPEGQQQAAYTNFVLPRLRARGMQAPDWTPETQDMILQTVDALTQWDDDPKDTPSGYREFEALTNAAGYKPGSDEYKKAAGVRLGTVGRPSSAGYSFDTIDIGDGKPRRLVNDPRTGLQMYYDERVGDYVQLGSGASGGQGPAPNPLPGAGGASAGTGHNRYRVEIEGVSPERQQQIANVVSTMRAADFSDDQIAGWLEGALQSDFFARQSEGNAPVQTGHPQPKVPMRAPVGLGAGRSKEEEAAAVRGAEIRTDLSYADQQAEAEANAAQRKKEAELQATQNSEAPQRIQKYEQALSAAGNVRQAITRALSLVGPDSTGYMGARMRGIEGSSAYDLAAALETVRANLGFDRLQQMRDASPTGGALGGIAIQELIALQSTISNIDPNQREDRLRESLRRIEQHYGKWEEAVRRAMQEEMNTSHGSGQRQAMPRIGEIRRGYRFKGGDPNDKNNWERQ